MALHFVWVLPHSPSDCERKRVFFSVKFETWTAVFLRISLAAVDHGYYCDMMCILALLSLGRPITCIISNFSGPWENAENRVKGHKDSKLCPNVNSWPFILSSFILAETREPDDIATGLKTIALLIPWVRTHASTKTNDHLAQLPITRHCNNFKICLPCSPSTIRPELCVSFVLRGGIWALEMTRNSTHPWPSRRIRNKLISCDYRGGRLFWDSL